MVRHAGAFGGTRLGRGDIESTVDLQGITADQFAAERFGKLDGEGSLAAARGSDDGEEGGAC